MMMFRTVKSAVISILAAAETGKYVTVGGQKQSKGADENLDLPRVAFFYRSGDFPQSGGSFQAVRKHDAQYALQFTVIQSATVDLSVLNNSSSTSVQIAAALAAMPELANAADDRMDELFDDVYQVLMSASNYDLGLPVGDSVDRYIDNFQKDDPVPRGEYLILTGSCLFTCSMQEEVTGDTGTPASSMDTTIDLDEDQGDNMGVENTLT